MNGETDLMSFINLQMRLMIQKNYMKMDYQLEWQLRSIII